MRNTMFTYCVALGLGCGAPGGRVDDSGDADKQAEDQARRLAAPHETKARECEAEGKLREAIKHYVAAIQSLPEGNATAKDFELREKAIKIVLSLDPPPAISEEVQQMFNRAEAMAREAKEPVGWSKAAAEYERGLRYSPWEAKGNYNAGLLHELLNAHALAVRRLKLYLAASPEARDREDVQKKIAGLDVRAGKQGLARLDGTWKAYELDGKEVTYLPPRHFRMEARGQEIVVHTVNEADDAVFGELKGEVKLAFKLKAEGRRVSGRGAGTFSSRIRINGIVSEDFDRLDLVMDDGERPQPSEYVFKRLNR